MKKRIVVTGTGVVSSIGIGKDAFWENLISGRSGISEVETFDTAKYEIHKGGEVKGFKEQEFMSKSCAEEVGRASQFAIAASKLALEDANMKLSELLHEKALVAVGTTMGEGGMIEEVDKHWTSKGEEDVWALTVSKYPSNAISDNVSKALKISGKSCVISTACAAGNYSIGFGYDMIRCGKADVAIVGGADPFSRIGFTGFGRLYAMAPEKCQPFDKNRKGMMLGEGAGILVLETLESAEKRGADIYAEILGYGLSCDASHMTMPSVEGIRKVMEKAIRNAEIKKEDVDYVCAHGTGTPANDKIETGSIKEVFGDRAKDIPVSSIKSMLGHTMGAASAIEAIACCSAIRANILPPTINLETPDPECDLDYVKDVSRGKDLGTILNNSFAFGGNNACVAIGQYNE